MNRMQSADLGEEVVYDLYEMALCFKSWWTLLQTSLNIT